MVAILLRVVGFMLIIVLGGMAALRLLIPNGTLNIVVVPSKATITLDSKASRSGEHNISPGNHTIVVKYPDFDTATVTVKVNARETITKSIALTSSNGNALRKLVEDDPEAIAAGEGAAGADIEQNAEALSRRYPIINQLPYQGAGYKIDIGLSEKQPKNSNAFALYITSKDPATKTRAQKWIQAQGYNLNDFEIIYREGN